MKGVTVIDHPLVQHKLTIMRKKETSTAGFRRLLREISLLLGYEVTRNLELTTTTIETPMETLMLGLCQVPESRSDKLYKQLETNWILPGLRHYRPCGADHG